MIANNLENLENLEKNVKYYIEKDKYDSIVAIYAMGSSVKKQNFNDYDINVFVKNDDFNEILKLEKMKLFLEENLKKKIDYNIIGMECIENNLINTDLFLHKNRHSMLLYEIVTLKNLVYGEDILNNYKVEYYDLILESLKLSMTHVHRLNKEYLAKKKEDAYVHARKYLKYTIEFAMIFSGHENPYINLKKEDVINKYPNLKKYENEIEQAINDRDTNLENAYNCIVDLSKQMLERFKYLISYINNNEKLVLNENVREKYFKFKSEKELEKFKKIYLQQENYKKIIV